MMEKISIREANSSDLEITFQWANNSETRKNSFYSSSISFVEHSEWFWEKLKSDQSKLYIVSLRNVKIGLVRFEFNMETTIGIVIAPEFRGKGLASVIIDLACATLWKTNTNSMPVRAYIKEENVASIRSFLKAGFILERYDVVNEISCQVLKKNPNDYRNT